MIDPRLPSTADRLAALRKPLQKRRKPAYNSKIVTAGMSATALFAMVTAMGWQTKTQAASASDAVTPAVQLGPAVPIATTTVPIVTVAASVATLPAVVPETAAPVTVPAPVVAPAPVIISLAVPVAQLPVQGTSGRKSNTATKASG